MSDEKLYTEREVRERERKAFVSGGRWMLRDGQSYVAPKPVEAAEMEARHRYPITRKVPREVVVNSTNFGPTRVRFINGAFQAKRFGGWARQHSTITPDNVKALADLIANPYEEVTE